MSAPPPTRSVIRLLVGVIAGLLAVAGAVLVLGESDDAADVAGTESADSPAASPSDEASPFTEATPSAMASPTPSPSASPDPAPSATASPQADAPLRDLATLVPERVAGFTQTSNRPDRRLLTRARVAEARRVRYRNDAGDAVVHRVSLHRGNAAAGRALRGQRAQALERRGARVVDDTGLEDTDGVRRGRLLQVRTRSGEIIVLWRNRNLVARLGPGRARLQRRLYDAWPY